MFDTAIAAEEIALYNKFVDGLSMNYKQFEQAVVGKY